MGFKPEWGLYTHFTGRQNGTRPPSLVQKVYKELGGKGKVEVFGNRIYVMEECGENGRFGFEVSVGD